MGDVLFRILLGVLFVSCAIGVTALGYAFTMLAIRHWPYSMIAFPAIVAFYLIGYAWEELL